MLRGVIVIIEREIFAPAVAIFASGFIAKIEKDQGYCCPHSGRKC